MVRPAERRQAADYLLETYRMSERRACQVTVLHRSTMQYEPQPDPNEGIRLRLKELAEQRPRWGQPRLHYLLRKEGIVINHKRSERLYREMGLSLQLRKRKKRASHLRVVMPSPARPNERWSMDFVSDQMVTGRRLKCFTLVDDCSRESPVIEVRHSITGYHVVAILDRIKEERPLPQVIVCDNGPEFTSKVLDEWAHRNNLKLDFIDPGRPVQNAYIESFNGKFRDECLNENIFFDLGDAKKKIEDYRRDYNTERPHSSLGNESPETFAKQYQPMLPKKTGTREVMTGP